MTDRIRQWFADHGDGEFAISPPGSPYLVVPAASPSDCVVYCTKPRLIVGRVEQGSTKVPFGVIGRYGLPDDYDVAWIQSFVAGRRFVFLGDADPPDLLIFAWLRCRLDISFSGLNDSLFDQSRIVWNDRITIPQSATESNATSLLSEELSETASLVGPRCAATLESGGKCELETLFSLSTLEPSSIFRAIVA